MSKYDEVYAIAQKEMGIHDVAGPENNPRILEYAKCTSLDASNDETPWCSAFANWCLAQAGVKGTNSAWAKSFLGWGTKLDTPVKGCIAVFSRLQGGHVAFFDHAEGDLIYCLGGNQQDQVKISIFSKLHFIEYRAYPISDT